MVETEKFRLKHWKALFWRVYYNISTTIKGESSKHDTLPLWDDYVVMNDEDGN